MSPRYRSPRTESGNRGAVAAGWNLTLARARGEAPKCKLVGPKEETLAIPEAVCTVLERVAEVMARGDSITTVPVGSG